jgi:peroxiredoxin
MRLAAATLACVLLGCAVPPPPNPPPPAIAIGEKLPPTKSLRDVRGNRRSVADFKDYRAIVLVFAGTKCAATADALAGLVGLEKPYRDKKVKFLLVYPHEPDALDAIAAHADDRDVPFLLLKDFGQKLADSVGVTRTPAVALFDGELTLRARGSVDGLTRSLDELLDGKPISAAETEPRGTDLVRQLPAPAGLKEVTFTRDVAPILQQRCQNCHRPGQIGPFPLVSYEDAADHAVMMREVVTQRRMPPWQADGRFGKFDNDRALTDAEIDAIRRWVDAGKPAGDPKDLPPPRNWHDGWTIGKPDLILSMPEEVEVPAQGVMPYKYFRVKTGFTEDVWVQKSEIKPGDPSVLHHVLVYLRKPGTPIYAADGTMSLLVGWAPGDMAGVNPPGTARRIPKDAELLWEVHYTPNGKATRDRTSVGLVFAPGPPERESHVNIFAKLNINIPPGEPHHREEVRFTFDEDARIISLTPHMHLRGKSFRYEIRYPDGRAETVLSVPRWDFNWQTIYRFAEPLKVPKGTRIVGIAHWDNSDNNPLNPDPTKRVLYGLQTYQEMLNGFIHYTWEKPTQR